LRGIKPNCRSSWCTPELKLSVGPQAAYAFVAKHIDSAGPKQHRVRALAASISLGGWAVGVVAAGVLLHLRALGDNGVACLVRSGTRAALVPALVSD
jgi:hypothetical protein